MGPGGIRRESEFSFFGGWGGRLRYEVRREVMNLKFKITISLVPYFQMGEERREGFEM